jgi:uncharacterized membrane protein (UPF0127 family)
MTSVIEAPKRRVGRFWLVLLLTVLLSFVTACTGRSEHAKVELGFVSTTGDKSPPFDVEVVSTPSTRAHGLMFRREVGERDGMLFVFPDERVQSFWMKNTLVPLDMVFVSKERKVVGILENVPPLTEDPRVVDSPSLYVIEFAGGTMKRLGIRVGSTVEIRGQLPRAL